MTSNPQSQEMSPEKMAAQFADWETYKADEGDLPGEPLRAFWVACKRGYLAGFKASTAIHEAEKREIAKEAALFCAKHLIEQGKDDKWHPSYWHPSYKLWIIEESLPEFWTKRSVRSVKVEEG